MLTVDHKVHRDAAAAAAAAHLDQAGRLPSWSHAARHVGGGG